MGVRLAKICVFLVLAPTINSWKTVTSLQTLSSSYVEIRNAASTKCIGPTSAPVIYGNFITLQTCSGDSSQAWKFISTDSTAYTVKNLKTGLCLDVFGASTKTKAKIIQGRCLKIKSQKFKLSLDGTVWKIFSVNSGLSLDVPGYIATDGTQIEQYAEKSESNQRWQFVVWKLSLSPLRTTYNHIHSFASDKCIGPQKGVLRDSTEIALQTCTWDLSQAWQFLPQTDNQSLIINLKSGMCLSVAGDSTKSKAKILQRLCRRTTSQLFLLSAVSDGIYKISGVKSGLSLDVPASLAVDGTTIEQYPYKSGTNQKWRLAPWQTPQTVPVNFTQITALAPNKCLGPAGGSKGSGAPITLQTCCNKSSQAWRFVPGDKGQFTAVNRWSGLCLAVSGGSAAPGAGIVQARCSGVASQQLVLSVVNGVWKVLTVSSGLSLDVPPFKVADGTQVQQRAYRARPSQAWRFVQWPPPPQIAEAPLYIKNAASGKCIGPISGMFYDGAQITLQTCSGDETQAWSFASLSCGWYRIVNLKTGMCLAIAQASSQDGAMVVQAVCRDTPSQRWVSTSIRENFNLAALHSGLYLDVIAQQRSDGALIEQASYSGGSSQEWQYVAWEGPPPLPIAYVSIRRAPQGRCLAPRSGATKDGTPAVLADCSSGDWSQKWQFRVVDAGRYILVNQKSGSCLAVSGASTASSATVVITACQKPSGPTEQWAPAMLSGGAWTMVAAHSGLYLDTLAASASAGAQAVQASSSGRPSQRWSLTLTPTPDGPPSQWVGPMPMPIVAIAAVIMADGKVTTWSSSQIDTYGTGELQTYSSTYDPDTGRISQRLLTNIKADIFCPATAMLSNGVLLVAGGVSSGETSLFDGSTWSRGAQLKIPRGYNSATLTADGSVFTLGGSWSGGRGGKLGELWTSQNGWRILKKIPTDLFNTADTGGIFRQDNQMWLVSSAAGWVFHAGPSRAMHWIHLEGEGTIVPVGLRGDDKDAMNGNAVLYDVNKIVTFGGAPNYEGGVSSAAVFVIDISAGPGKKVKVRRTASMRYPRAFHNSVLLPDGAVVILGGQGGSTRLFSDAYAQLVPEIWDPKTETLSLLKPMAKPRMYHSVALLLLDGRIFASGGGACGSGCVANHFDFEILTPPYLLNADGSLRSRPVITSAPKTASAGSSMSVRAKQAASFSLVRMSSVTHAINTDQRRIPLVSTLINGSYVLLIPGVSIALPGNYMLFALSASGTPSVAHVVRIS